MDAKVTKKRLSDFLAYEWILVIAVIVAAVFLWELIFSVAAVRLAPGQSFNYYYDENVMSVPSFYDEVVKNGVFSYDVIGGVGYEKLTSSTVGTVLEARLAVDEGDAIITDCIEEEGEPVRVRELIDGYKMYSLDEYLLDAETYLSKFYDGEVLNEQAVKDNFRKRMKKDNRFRTESEKLKGEVLEIERIVKLKQDVKDFRKVYDEHPEIFYTYTKFTQLSERSKTDKEYYEKILQKEKDNNTAKYGKEELRYGLKVGALTGGTDPVNYFSIDSGEGYSAENVVILMFKVNQGDLNYEGISFLTAIIKKCSNFLGE